MFPLIFIIGKGCLFHALQLHHFLHCST
uniref:Uncharacterized protein n=1 Tax=Rhizophora mucronata TaxID=61149 RepID=A0A2P2IT79_RHIMU